MATWLDAQPTTIIRSALGAGADDHKSEERRFNLWLALVDLHLEQLNVQRPVGEWDWHSSYEDGWSPRTAAFAAWAKSAPRDGHGGPAVTGRGCV